MTNQEDTRFVLLLSKNAKPTAHHVLPYAQARSRAKTGEQYDLWLEFKTEKDARRACTDYNDLGRIIPAGNGV
jgi:hypothetical protein